jgi:hypothetical protein
VRAIQYKSLKGVVVELHIPWMSWEGVIPPPSVVIISPKAGEMIFYYEGDKS